MSELSQGELLEYLSRRIDDARTLVYDSETNGLRWATCHTVGHVLSFGPDPLDSYYLPIRHASGPNLDPDRVNAMLRASINHRQDLRVVGHNLSFDMHFMANDAIRPAGPLEDTQINAALIDERQLHFNLAACCEFMGTAAKKEDLIYAHLASKFGGNATRSQMANYWRLGADDPVAIEYATGDGVSTWQLWEKQQEELDAQDLRYIWGIECRCIRVLHRMTRRGVRIDEERLGQVTRLVDARIIRAQEKLPRGFNENAPTQLKKLFTDAGFTDWPTTPPSNKFPNGQPSFPELWLKTNPVGLDVLAVRKLSHLRDTFLTPMQERHMHRGRVHTTYNQTRGEFLGTITGRLSSSDPNLQQCPKRDEILGPVFRSIFVPDGGLTWGSADYEQIEPHLLAHYGRVKVLLDGYMSDPPVDAHRAVSIAAGIDRPAGKRLNQALITGAGDRKAAMMLERPMAEAEAIVRQYFKAMPEIKVLQRQASRVYEQRGYVRSLLGRRARLEDRRFSYKAVNKLLQCGNADILKKAMVDVDDYLASEGDQVHMLINVHDALDFQFPEECRHQYDRALEIMCDYGPGKSVHIDVPLSVDADDGDSWAVATYGIDTVRRSFVEMGSSYDRV